MRPATVFVTVLAACVIAACGADGARDAERPRASLARTPSAVGVADTRGESVGPALVHPSAASLETPNAKVAANTACEGCHADIAAEWHRSLHAASWDDPVFLSAYAIEPLGFCRSCHAPEAPLEDSSSPARHLGAGCITCHVPERTAPDGAHVSFAARGADTEGCAGCHQFEFPESQAAAMQSTVAEHAASPEHDKSCASCHMPPGVGDAKGVRPHRDHTFGVHGDAAFLRSSVRASARRGGARSIEVSLAARGVGHAVPTGDMFRRIEVQASAGDDVRAEPVVFARQFIHVTSELGVGRQQVDDRRLPASGDARVARLVFARPIDDAPIRWKVVYRRMGPNEAALFGVDLDAEAVVLAEGVLPPLAAPPSASPAPVSTAHWRQ